MSDFVLQLWVIYDQPSDFPDGFFVARRWEVHQDAQGLPTPTEDIMRGVSLEAIRDNMREMNLVSLPADPMDDPTIVETWL